MQFLVSKLEKTEAEVEELKTADQGEQHVTELL